jgi:hypothetical protein
MQPWGKWWIQEGSRKVIFDQGNPQAAPSSRPSKTGVFLLLLASEDKSSPVAKLLKHPN